jgi:beta-lactamase superfamily II metal-dependent hydrolase
VGGRLLHFASFWKRAVSDAWVLDLITCGHSIEFTSKPKLSSNIRWTRLQDPGKSRVLDEEIVALLQKDAIEEVDPLSPGYYSTFFVVPKS